MRKPFLAMLAICSALIVGVAIAADSYVGTWAGTWEGAGSGGKFDLTVGADGSKPTASVSVGSEGGDYQAKFSVVTINGNKLNGKYPYPLDEQGEVTITATFEGNKCTGTWSLGAKGQDGPGMANGTFAVTKK